MVEVAVLFGLLFAIFCGALTVTHSLRVCRLTLLDWAVLAIGGMYGLGWVFVLLVTQAGGNPVWEAWVNPFSSYYLIHTAAAFLLVGGVLAGWYIYARWFPLTLARVHHRIPATAGKWSLACWLLLFIAVLLQCLYTKAYGGYLGALDYSALIRSSLFQEVPSNSWSFLKPFGGLAMIASFGFFGLWLSGRRNARMGLGLVIAFLFSLYILFSWLGRLGFLVYLAVFILGWVLFHRPSPLPLLAWGALFFIGLLGAAYGLSVMLNLKSADSFAEFLARELAFPFGSFFAQLSHGEHLFRGFVDFLMTPVFLLPSSWWSSWFEPVSQVNTAIIMGAPKGEAGVTGGIPVDLLTLGLMQAHIIGVLVVGALFGFFLRVLQALIDRIPVDGVRFVFEAYVVLKIAVLGVFYAQPNLVVSGNFAAIVSALIVFIVVRSRRISFVNRKVLREPIV